MNKLRAILIIFAITFRTTQLAGAGQDRHEIEVLGMKIPFREDPRRDMIVIEGEVLRRLPAVQIAELVALAANMNFTVRGMFQADPQMQGFNQEQIAVLVDGIPVANAQTGHHNFLLPVAADDIARIEVLRGGFSSRFGTSGGGGQVNIITAAGNRLSLRRSSFRTTDVSASAGSETLRAAAGFTDTAGYADGLDGRRAFARAGGRLTGLASFLDVQAGFVGARFGAANFYGPYPSAEEVSRFLGALSGGTRLSASLMGNFQISGQASRDDFRLDRRDPEKYRNLHDTRQASAEASIRGTGRAFDYSAGIVSTWDEIESGGIRAGLSVPALGRHRRLFHSFRAAAGREAGDWSWRAGIDAGFGDYRGWGGSLVLGRSWGTNVRLAGSVSRTYRVPTYTELYYADPIHLSDSSLKPERTDSASLSAGGILGALSWGCRLFSNRTRDLIDWTRPLNGEIWKAANICGGSFGGIDLHGEIRKGKFQARVLYTYQKTRFVAGPEAAALKYHYYFPDHCLSLIALGESGVWSGSVALKIEREETSGRVRPYLGGRLRRTMGRFEIFADLQNLFNQRVEKIPGLPEAPRAVGLGLGFAF
ncbi:MAG: TonB-dependent receptor [Candidatus Aminicenantes bacterium]|nr:TonB-dependent receptor [Candidatus Aminicenantes bacterium]